MKRQFHALLLLSACNFGCTCARAGRCRCDGVIHCVGAGRPSPNRPFVADERRYQHHVGRPENHFPKPSGRCLPNCPATIGVSPTKTLKRGDAFEYIVLQQGPPQAGSGWCMLAWTWRRGCRAGRGKFILVVDNTLAAPLATELARFEDDLRGDGCAP